MKILNIGDTDENADWILTPEKRREELAIFDLLEFGEKGGGTSGHYGHEGRPGKQGGSVEGTTLRAISQHVWDRAGKRARFKLIRTAVGHLRKNPVLPESRKAKWHLPMVFEGKVAGILVGDDARAVTVLSPKMKPYKGSQLVMFGRGKAKEYSSEELRTLLDFVRKGSGHSGHYGHPGGKGPGPGGSKPTVNVSAPALTSSLLTRMNEGSYEKGVFESYRVEVENDGTAIVKPRVPDQVKKKEYGLPADYSFVEREALAYKVAEAMGFDGLVPQTVVREVDGRPASVQLWVEGAKIAADMDGDDWQRISESEIKKILLFDAVLGNADRHSANYLIKGEKLIAIDNGTAFYELPLPVLGAPRRLWEAARRQSFDWRAADFDPLRQLLANRGAMRSIKEVISDRSFAVFRSRVDRILEEEKV